MPGRNLARSSGEKPLVALARRVREGGSWSVRISLTQVGRWLVGLGQVPESELHDVSREFTPDELERWTKTWSLPDI